MSLLSVLYNASLMQCFMKGKKCLKFVHVGKFIYTHNIFINVIHICRYTVDIYIYKSSSLKVLNRWKGPSHKIRSAWKWNTRTCGDMKCWTWKNLQLSLWFLMGLWRSYAIQTYSNAYRLTISFEELMLTLASLWIPPAGSKPIQPIRICFLPFPCFSLLN
jgi:hypothetical protein